MTVPRTTDDLVVLVFDEMPVPVYIKTWLGSGNFSSLYHASNEDLLALAARSRPKAIVLDFRDSHSGKMELLCNKLKADSWTSIIPLVAIANDNDIARLLDLGADEVLSEMCEEELALARLNAVFRRSDRDTDVHPSTRLLGARAIEFELTQRIRSGIPFAACYADLDHFKEFNDRYGFYHGNKVIALLATLLNDIVKGFCGASGFVGHIGGDDFLFIVPQESLAEVCDLVIEAFDQLFPLQYSEADRRAGYFLGKDRRNQLHRVPLMTLSIGVVTNQHRRFQKAADVSELATEMKSYAKTLPGSVWTLDRRRDSAEEVISIDKMRSQKRRLGDL